MKTEISPKPASASGADEATSARRYPIGAEPVSESTTHFRVWAPKARCVEVVVEASSAKNARRTLHPLAAEPDGYFSGLAPARPGDRYRFRLDEGHKFYPDPASRYQPDGPHESSLVIDPRQFRWTDQSWPGVQLHGQIICEFHVGTFTAEGTWRAAAEKLRLLREDGITLLEMMPVADFPGRFGWGYDGVNFFAPCHLYGTPDDLRYFIDCAHSLGLGVILDVVYNHFGPDGNYLGCFSDYYVSKAKPNEWGDCINFDGEHSGPVREFFITNGRYWIDEFHFDGFRFDATQSIVDKSENYIVAEVGTAARAAAGNRSIVLIAENEPQETNLIRPREDGGDGLDGLWNDDWHHTAMVALTGNREAYYTDYLGTPQEFISAAKYGYLFQGQVYLWQQAPRGRPTSGASPAAFISFIENHDQVANTPFGERVRQLTSPGRYRAMTALLILGPWTPLLFQGEQFGATRPFRYFSDVGDDKLKEAIRQGRFKFLSQFPSAATSEMQARLPVPSNPETFRSCKIDWGDRARNPQVTSLHRDLIRLRREDERFRQVMPHGVDGAVLGRRSFVLRYFAAQPEESRLLVVNFGEQQSFAPAPEPLLAPPDGYDWETMWSSEAPEYGGAGTSAVNHDLGWTLRAESAVALQPVRLTKPRRKPKQQN